jgi:hypothetical protein
VVFDEHVFPFANLPTPSTLSITHTTSVSMDQFANIVHCPTLFSNHGAGPGRGTRPQLLELDTAPATSPAAHVDRDQEDHVDHVSSMRAHE